MNDTLVGKILISVGWICTIISGQMMAYVLSSIASVFAIIYWCVKIYKEIKK